MGKEINPLLVTQALENFLLSEKRKESTRKKYSYKLAGFLDTYGEIDVSQVTAANCLEWFNGLVDRGYSEGNLSMYRACLIAFLTAYRPGDNPAASIPRQSDRPLRVIVPEDDTILKAVFVAKQLLNSENPMELRNAAVLALSVATGGRRCEIKNLTTTEATIGLSKPLHNRDGKYYILWTTGKTGRVKLIVSENVKLFVDAWLEVKPKAKHNRLFVALNSSHYGKPLTDIGLNRCIHYVCQQAGIENLSFQLLRRYKATTIAAKYGIEVAARVLNHRSGTYTLRHFYYDPDQNEAATAALESSPI